MSARIGDQLYVGLDQSAGEGLGTPMVDGDAQAWCRLVAAGILSA